MSRPMVPPPTTTADCVLFKAPLPWPFTRTIAGRLTLRRAGHCGRCGRRGRGGVPGAPRRYWGCSPAMAHLQVQR
ncbi:MAG: hypothetical protein MZW92_35280 [Comamonadaceae bacterium]|nr:hypothetical protein [Comamonadaceae bacterium]